MQESKVFDNTTSSPGFLVFQYGGAIKKILGHSRTRNQNEQIPGTRLSTALLTKWTEMFVPLALDFTWYFSFKFFFFFPLRLILKHLKPPFFSHNFKWPEGLALLPINFLLICVQSLETLSIRSQWTPTNDWETGHSNETLSVYPVLSPCTP